MSVRVRPSADKKEARFSYVNRMPSCVVVAQGTLDPLAQVRILARQPLRTVPEPLALESIRPKEAFSSTSDSTSS